MRRQPSLGFPPLDERVQRAVDGSVDAGALRRCDDRAVDGVDFRRAARRDVLHHGALRVGNLVEQLVGVVESLLRVDVVAQRPGDGDGLDDGRVHQGPHLGVAHLLAAGHAEERGRGERRCAEHELLPDLGRDRPGGVRVEPGLDEHGRAALRGREVLALVRPDEGDGAARVLDLAGPERGAALGGDADHDLGGGEDARPGSLRGPRRSAA